MNKLLYISTLNIDVYTYYPALSSINGNIISHLPLIIIIIQMAIELLLLYSHNHIKLYRISQHNNMQLVIIIIIPFMV